MRPRNRRGFTLIEMLVVILLALLLMGLGANAFKNLSNSQKLSIGAGAVCAALQQARAHALKTRQVTAVYFLDAGECTPDRIKLKEDGVTKTGVTKFSSYDDIRKADVPYELLIWSDGEAVNSIKLPEGIAWMDLNRYPADYDNPDRPYYHRPCSLVINFTPSGSAWAEILNIPESGPGSFSAAPDVACRTTASYTNIRVFNLGHLPPPPYAQSFTFALVNNDDANGGFGVFTKKNKSGTDTKQCGNKKPSSIFASTHWDNVKYMRNFTWITVHLNYQTGIAEMVNGAKETWTEP